MKTITTFALGSGTAIAIVLSGLIVHAGGWGNFKLRYFSLTQVLSDQTQELDALQKQGVDIESTARISLDDLLNGGPPKDGIPSIDTPEFDVADTTPFNRDDTVIGIVINGEAKAYPYGIMNWHEIVNDTIGGVNVSVSYCPLCDTILAFNRGSTTFGVSGKLYQSCLVMYDRQNDTLYAQPWGFGIIGPAVNESVERIPTVKTTLGAWLDQHPDSKILSVNTGHQRDYFRYPYGTYYTDDQLIFPVRNRSSLEGHPKDIVTYVWEPDTQTPRNIFSGHSVMFNHDELASTGEQMTELGDRQIRARWDTALSTVIVEDEDGAILPSSTAFAFVYPAFFEP
ncbi:MAG: DUF3179 domain-containing protein [Cyanobacteria bacterium P01_E01_bin.6]